MQTDVANDTGFEAFVTAWERLEPIIEKALPRLNGTTTLEGLYDMICDGRAYFFAGKRTFAVGYLMQHETCRSFNAFLTGADGGSEELLEVVVPMMEQFARAAGAKFIHMDVRQGFIGRGDHTKLGYRVDSVSLSKELSHG